MDYKICKELKDKGFPQEGNGGWYYKLSTMKEWGFKSTSSFESKHNKTVYVPTLEELILECGNGFKLLEKTAVNWKCLPNPSDGLDWTSGETPKDAVAKLYIKLKEKV